MKVTKWSQMLAVCAAATMMLSACSSSDSGGVAPTPLTTTAAAQDAAAVTQSINALPTAFEAGMPTLPPEIAAYAFYAPKANKDMKGADRFAARKAKAPTTDPIVCDAGTAEVTYEYTSTLNTESYTFTGCAIPFVGNDAAAACVINGTYAYTWKQTATGDINSYTYSEKLGNGNGIAEDADFSIVCTDGAQVVTIKSDNLYNDAWSDGQLNKGSYSGADSERGAIIVTDVGGTPETSANASWAESDNYSGTWDYSVVDVGAETWHDGWNGSMKLFYDDDTSDAVVALDVALTDSGYSNGTYTVNLTEEYETWADSDTLSLVRNDDGCGAGVYTVIDNGKFDFLANDQTGKVVVNGALVVEWLAGDVVKLTLNGVVDETVTNDATLATWSGGAVCAL